MLPVLSQGSLHFDCIEYFRFRMILEEEAHSSVVVKALCYKPEGRGFETRLSEFLNFPNPSGRTRPCGLLGL
jgi:hypothetical protein